MADKRKIIIMTKLAIYDKHYGEKDRKTNEYYQHDYVFRKNSLTRFYTFIGSIFILFFQWTYRFATEEIDIFELDYSVILREAAIFVVIVAVLYTAIGSISAIAEYRRSQRRLKKYLSLIKHLEEIKSGTKEASDDEGDFVNTGNNS